MKHILINDISNSRFTEENIRTLEKVHDCVTIIILWSANTEIPARLLRNRTI
uniref:Uncharacterized protein n=1 Tax=Arundo donax TaxID=35708 RepID=A0A0A9FBW0_ARUDO